MNIFKNDTKSIPMRKADAFIVRTPMDQNDIAGRKDHLPGQEKSSDMTISHTPNRG